MAVELSMDVLRRRRRYTAHDVGLQRHRVGAERHEGVDELLSLRSDAAVLVHRKGDELVAHIARRNRLQMLAGLLVLLAVAMEPGEASLRSPRARLCVLVSDDVDIGVAFGRRDVRETHIAANARVGGHACRLKRAGDAYERGRLVQDPGDVVVPSGPKSGAAFAARYDAVEVSIDVVPRAAGASGRVLHSADGRRLNQLRDGQAHRKAGCEHVVGHLKAGVASGRDGH